MLNKARSLVLVLLLLLLKIQVYYSLTALENKPSFRQQYLLTIKAVNFRSSSLLLPPLKSFSSDLFSSVWQKAIRFCCTQVQEARWYQQKQCVPLSLRNEKKQSKEWKRNRF